MIVERIPIPERIVHAQDRESIIETEVRDHMQRALCPLHQVTQSERRMIAWSDKTLRRVVTPAATTQTKSRNPLE
jgi:hypothetical protein